MKRAAIFAILILLAIPLTVSAAGSGAVVIRNYSCFVNSDASGIEIPLETTRMQTVATPSGNTRLTCHFRIPAAYRPGRALHHSGFACSTYLGLTYNSSAVSTPGGWVHLTCLVKHGS